MINFNVIQFTNYKKRHEIKLLRKYIHKCKFANQSDPGRDYIFNTINSLHIICVKSNRCIKTIFVLAKMLHTRKLLETL